MPLELTMPPPSTLSGPRSSFGPGYREREHAMMRNGTPPQPFREPPVGSYYAPHLSASNGDSWPQRSPRFDDRAGLLPGDGTAHRSSDSRAERGPTASYASAYPSAGTTSKADERLPPVSAIDPALADSHKPAPSVDVHGRRLSSRSQASQEQIRAEGNSNHSRSYSARESAALRGVDRLQLRGAQPGSSSSSADWDSTSERGSPSLAPGRPYGTAEEPRNYPNQTNATYVPRRTSGGKAAHPYAYEEEYSPAPAHGSVPPLPLGARRMLDVRAYTEASYDGEPRLPMRRGESPPPPPPPSRPLKRKPSFSEGPLPPRRPIYDPTAPGSRERDDERLQREYYYERGAQPRPYPRPVEPLAAERGTGGSYPPPYEAPYPGAPSRYAGEAADVRYSPRHRPRSPLPLPAQEAYRSNRYGHHYDGQAPSGPGGSGGYVERRTGGRYSPTASPSYTHRASSGSSQPPGGPPPPPPPGADYYPTSQRGSAVRHRSPSFTSEGRPHLPHPSLPSTVTNSRGRRGRGSPPVEMIIRRTPSPGLPTLSNEPFYPDRRFYYPRDRIQDVDIDEYYNEGPGRSRAAGHPPHYAPPPPHAPQDPYGPSPTTSFLPPPVSLGAHIPPSRNHPVVIPLVVPPPAPPGHPGHPSLRHHDPRHLVHGHEYDSRHDLAPPSRSHAVVGIPPPHVPPGPSTGIAPPPRRRGKLPKPVTDLLKSWLLDHASHPYPTEDEKRSLCSMTGLTLQQVSNWFINARRRILLPGSGGSSGGGATAEQVQAAFSQDSPSPPGSDA
ncbi:homeodomain superfamily [Thecaphora frezii]